MSLFNRLLTPQVFLQTTTNYQTVIVPIIDEVLVKLVLFTKDAPLFKQLEVGTQLQTLRRGGARQHLLIWLS